MYSRISATSEWDGKTLSLQLTSILPVTCYAAVLWPDPWLQCQSDHCLWGCSGVQSDMNTLELGRWRNMWGECEQAMQWVSKLMLHQITRLSLTTVCHKLLTCEGLGKLSSMLWQIAMYDEIPLFLVNTQPGLSCTVLTFTNSSTMSPHMLNNTTRQS